MATIKLNYKIEDKAILQGLRRLERAGGNMRTAFMDIGESMLLSTEDRFNNQVDPDGRPWVELADSTRKRKRHTKILSERLILRGSIEYIPSATQLEWGTRLQDYSRIHQFGGMAGRGRLVKIPARPYLGISAADRDLIIRKLEEHYRRALNG
ncbi:MAG TPA: phage virion morphogenesis protein [Chromatiales bacterium]|nr:phage virion morphogenesis protein [Chromatiales bacterium]HEX22781.1 phage virion morphogenesis protein [Chromatiales bacterium]